MVISSQTDHMTIEDLQAICKTLPAVTEDIKWGQDLTFCVGAKMFCVTGLDQTPISASFKVMDEEFEELSVRQHFMPAPYVARYKWVLLTDISKIKREELEHYIKQSYKLVSEKLPAKIKKELGI